MSIWKFLSFMCLGAVLVLCGLAFAQQSVMEAVMILLCGIGCAICALLAVIIDRMPSKK